MAKFLYLSLFKYLFHTFSALFARKKGIKDDHVSFIGVLDFYGFEAFETDNNFDQFVINWTSEKFEQLFIKHVFETEHRIYSRESISTESMPHEKDIVQANMNVLNLLECPDAGLLSLVHLHTKAWHAQQSDDTRLLNEMNSKLKDNSHYQISEKVRHFVIHHFGGAVEYAIDDFIKQNDDYYPTAMVNIFQQSNNKVLADCTALYVQTTNYERETLNDQTVTRHFGLELNDLMDKIKATNPHFVRCIRTNQTKKPNDFDSLLVLKQIECLGLNDVIKIRNGGLPIRFWKYQFITRYIWLYQDREQIASFLSKRRTENTLNAKELDTISQDLMAAFWKNEHRENDGLKTHHLQHGTKHIFMTDEVYSELERLRDECLKVVFHRIEGTFMSRSTRSHYEKVRIVYKALKKSMDCSDYVMMAKSIQHIQNLTCSADIKDVLLNHHLVHKAKELLENKADNIIKKTKKKKKKKKVKKIHKHKHQKKQRKDDASLNKAQQIKMTQQNINTVIKDTSSEKDEKKVNVECDAQIAQSSKKMDPNTGLSSFEFSSLGSGDLNNYEEHKDKMADFKQLVSVIDVAQNIVRNENTNAHTVYVNRLIKNLSSPKQRESDPGFSVNRFIEDNDFGIQECYQISHEMERLKTALSLSTMNRNCQECGEDILRKIRLLNASQNTLDGMDIVEEMVETDGLQQDELKQDELQQKRKPFPSACSENGKVVADELTHIINEWEQDSSEFSKSRKHNDSDDVPIPMVQTDDVHVNDVPKVKLFTFAKEKSNRSETQPDESALNNSSHEMESDANVIRLFQCDSARGNVNGNTLKQSNVKSMALEHEHMCMEQLINITRSRVEHLVQHETDYVNLAMMEQQDNMDINANNVEPTNNGIESATETINSLIADNEKMLNGRSDELNYISVLCGVNVPGFICMLLQDTPVLEHPNNEYSKIGALSATTMVEIQKIESR
eukprot:859886_1